MELDRNKKIIESILKKTKILEINSALEVIKKVIELHKLNDSEESKKNVNALEKKIENKLLNAPFKILEIEDVNKTISYMPELCKSTPNIYKSGYVVHSTGNVPIKSHVSISEIRMYDIKDYKIKIDTINKLIEEVGVSPFVNYIILEKNQLKSSEKEILKNLQDIKQLKGLVKEFLKNTEYLKNEIDKLEEDNKNKIEYIKNSKKKLMSDIRTFNLNRKKLKKLTIALKMIEDLT